MGGEWSLSLSSTPQKNMGAVSKWGTFPVSYQLERERFDQERVAVKNA